MNMQVAHDVSRQWTSAAGRLDVQGDGPAGENHPR